MLEVEKYNQTNYSLNSWAIRSILIKARHGDVRRPLLKKKTQWIMLCLLIFHFVQSTRAGKSIQRKRTGTDTNIAAYTVNMLKIVGSSSYFKQFRYGFLISVNRIFFWKNTKIKWVLGGFSFETTVIENFSKFVLDFNTVLAVSHEHDFQSFTLIKHLILFTLLIRFERLQNNFIKYCQCSFKVNLVTRIIQKHMFWPKLMKIWNHNFQK